LATEVSGVVEGANPNASSGQQISEGVVGLGGNGGPTRIRLTIGIF